jgi:predicted GH43/DUF377 family glycosyl hydrolase
MRASRVLALFSLLFLTITSIPKDSSAQWMNTWKYRRPVYFHGCTDSLEDYQVLISLDGSFDFSRTKEDGSDIEFSTWSGGMPIPFWVETWEPSSLKAHIWVEVPLATISDTSLYMYYGDSAEVSVSNALETFVRYEGFDKYHVGATPRTVNPGEWTRYTSNPVLSEGPPGAWDDHGATFASVIYDSLAAEFRMYYHGFSGSTHQIGLAVSPNGINWTKYAGNPVLTPGPDAWDANQVRVPMVWKEGLTDYRMIYTGAGSGGMRVGYATSTDGITWTKHPSNPVFNDPTWASGDTENWGVMKVGSEYLMWYSDFGLRQSGIAVSTDLVNWTPYQSAPIFSSSGDPSDYRYSQYCPFSFRHGGYYYVLMPSYTAEANYSRNYMYRSASPYFPESDRELIRIVRTVGEEGQWDDHDGDTPFVFTLDIERTQFYNNELWCYYSSEGGSDLWKEGLFIESDIDAALAPAPLPADYLDWVSAGDITVVDDPVRYGSRSLCQYDGSGSLATQLKGFFSGQESGRVSAWMRRASTSAGDYDIYLYGGTALGCVAGMGRDGDFHYWDGAFHPTGIPWSIDTWYLITIYFDAASGLFDFTVLDGSMSELVRVDDIPFGNPSPDIDQAMFYTSSGYTGYAYMDGFRLSKWCGEEFLVTLGEEEAYSTGIGDMPPLISMELHQNYPNPFNPVTTIRYHVGIRSHVVIAVYDVNGRFVSRIFEGLAGPEISTVTWDGTNDNGAPAASGIYFCRLRAGEQSLSRKMILLR